MSGEVPLNQWGVLVKVLQLFEKFGSMRGCTIHLAGKPARKNLEQASRVANAFLGSD